jgi:hypothetical protein
VINREIERLRVHSKEGRLQNDEGSAKRIKLSPKIEPKFNSKIKKLSSN